MEVERVDEHRSVGEQVVEHLASRLVVRHRVEQETGAEHVGLVGVGPGPLDEPTADLLERGGSAELGLAQRTTGHQQMRMAVDESGHHHAPAHVDPLGVGTGSHFTVGEGAHGHDQFSIGDQRFGPQGLAIGGEHTSTHIQSPHHVAFDALAITDLQTS